MTYPHFVLWVVGINLMYLACQIIFKSVYNLKVDNNSGSVTTSGQVDMANWFNWLVAQLTLILILYICGYSVVKV